jgi:hypothetical protein
VVVILNEPPPEPLPPLVLPEDEEPLLLPDDDELLLLLPEDEEPLALEDEPLPPELELELELELIMAPLLLPPPPLHAATVKPKIAVSSLSGSVEWRMGSVLIQSATRRNNPYSRNSVRGKMSR